MRKSNTQDQVGKQVGNGVWLGLWLTAGAAGFWLMVRGLLSIYRPPDCEGLGPQDCALETELAVHAGARQILVGVALLLLGWGAYRWKLSKSP